MWDYCIPVYLCIISLICSALMLRMTRGLGRAGVHARYVLVVIENSVRQRSFRSRTIINYKFNPTTRVSNLLILSRMCGDFSLGKLRVWTHAAVFVGLCSTHFGRSLPVPFPRTLYVNSHYLHPKLGTNID